MLTRGSPCCAPKEVLVQLATAIGEQRDAPRRRLRPTSTRWTVVAQIEPDQATDSAWSVTHRILWQELHLFWHQYALLGSSGGCDAHGEHGRAGIGLKVSASKDQQEIQAQTI
jgi:hypothetical protein